MNKDKTVIIQNTLSHWVQVYGDDLPYNWKTILLSRHFLGKEGRIFASVFYCL